MDIGAIEEQYDDFLRLLRENVQRNQPNITHENLKDHPVYRLISTPNSDVYIPKIDSLAEGIVDALFRVEHTHVLQKICDIKAITKVLQVCLRKMIASVAVIVASLRSPSKPFIDWMVNTVALLSSHRPLGDVMLRDVQETERYNVDRLTSLCNDGNMRSLILILPVMIGDWNMIIRILEGDPFIVVPNLRLLFWVVLCEETPWTTTKYILRQILRTSEHLKVYRIKKSLLINVALKCKSEGWTEYMMMFYICAKEWDVVQREIEACQVPEEINDWLLEALEMWPCPWQAIQHLVPKCSDTSLLFQVFRKSIDSNADEIATIVLGSLKLQRREQNYIRDILEIILKHADRNERAEALILSCARTGMTTHCPHAVDILDQSLQRQDQSILPELLLRLGLVSYTQCYRRAEQDIPEADIHRLQFLQVMMDEGTRPLMEQCRLILSHQIGFHDGREDRISSLPLHEKLKTLLAFQDMNSDLSE